jgi:Tfp pilus assembly protein FimT
MIIQTKASRWRAGHGFSVLELVMVVALIGVLGVMALPQLASMRRAQRAATVPFLVKTQLRLARQQAMTQRRQVTFQYDDLLKQISIVNNGVQGTPISLIGSGVTASELVYGVPSGTPGVLNDGTSFTAVGGASQINITFQPDGSVINAAGLPTNFGLFFYNSKDPQDTASAISILGSAGRVKTWRYTSNGNKFVE